MGSVCKTSSVLSHSSNRSTNFLFSVKEHAAQRNNLFWCKFLPHLGLFFLVPLNLGRNNSVVLLTLLKSIKAQWFLGLELCFDIIPFYNKQVRFLPRFLYLYHAPISPIQTLLCKTRVVRKGTQYTFACAWYGTW